MKGRRAKIITTVNVNWAILGLLERFMLQAFLVSNLPPFHRGSTDETFDFIHLNRPFACFFRGLPPLAAEACRCGWLFRVLRPVRGWDVCRRADQLDRRAARREQSPAIRDVAGAVPMNLRP